MVTNDRRLFKANTKSTGDTNTGSSTRDVSS